MSPEAWATIGVGITTVGAIIVGYLKSKDNVEEVRRLAAPTGNGYADDTRRMLKEILESQARTESALLQHLTDHARAAINGKRS
jgi:hypothetical protein